MSGLALAQMLGLHLLHVPTDSGTAWRAGTQGAPKQGKKTLWKGSRWNWQVGKGACGGVGGCEWVGACACTCGLCLCLPIPFVL